MAGSRLKRLPTAVHRWNTVVLGSVSQLTTAYFHRARGHLLPLHGAWPKLTVADRLSGPLPLQPPPSPQPLRGSQLEQRAIVPSPTHC